MVDLSALGFIVPTFLLRLRAFVDYHLTHGYSVKVIAPTNREVANYISRMRIAADLPAEVFPDLPAVRANQQEDVLIPVSRLESDLHVEEMGDQIFRLLQGHADDDVAVFADALWEGFTELCQNGVEHGHNDLGCYVAAQRYKSREPKTVLALGDLGMGIPKHLRQVYEEESDRRLLRKALEEGVSGTGDNHRGNGIPSVLGEARSAQIRHAQLDIRSGRAHLKHRLGRGGQATTQTSKAGFKLGTWICFELGPLSRDS